MSPFDFAAEMSLPAIAVLSKFRSSKIQICKEPKTKVTGLNILARFIVLNLFRNLETCTKYFFFVLFCYFTYIIVCGESTNLAANVTKYPTGVWADGVPQT